MTDRVIDGLHVKNGGGNARESMHLCTSVDQSGLIQFSQSFISKSERTRARGTFLFIIDTSEMNNTHVQTNSTIAGDR